MNPKIIAEALKWSNKIFTIAGMMILPIVGGMFLDGMLGSVCAFTIFGTIVGFVGGMYSLLGIANSFSKTTNEEHNDRLS